MTPPSQPKTGACIVAGHLCLDVIPSLIGSGDFTANFLPGRLLEAGPAVMATGGTVSNTGLALHKLGIATRLMGKVGDDVFGQTILKLIKAVDERLVERTHVVPGESSSYTIILSPPNTDRIFFHCPGANDTFAAADIDYSILHEADLFHFGYPQLMRRMYEAEGRELTQIFQRAKATGITTSLDSAMPDPNAPSGRANWSTIFRNTLPYVDIFTPSIEEILLMLRPELFGQLTAKAKATGTEVLAHVTVALLSDVAAELLSMGTNIVLLKASYLGLYLRTADLTALDRMGRARPAGLTTWANRELWSASFQTRVVGTTGAGDSAAAGFLAALLRGMSPAEALTIANAVGACNVEASDAVSGVRSWAETLARIESGWSRRTLKVDDPGWRFDEVQQAWQGPGNSSDYVNSNHTS